MTTKQSIVSFKYKYLIAISIVVALLITSQALIQLTLQHEIERRATASVIGRQRTRDLLLSSYSKNIALGYPLSSLQKQTMIQTYNDWTKVENALEGSGSVQLGIPDTFTPDIEAQIRMLHQDYVPLHASFGFIVANQQAAHPVDIARLVKASSKSVTVMLTHDERYQNTVLAIYGLLNDQANENVTKVQVIEFIVFIATLLVISYEIVFAFLPSLRELNESLAQIKKEDCMQANEAVS